MTRQDVRMIQAMLQMLSDACNDVSFCARKQKVVPLKTVENYVDNIYNALDDISEQLQEESK